MSQSVQQGWSQATAAMKAIMGAGIGSAVRRATGSGGRTRKRKAAASRSSSRPKKSASSRSRSKRASGSKAHLVKGSAAAKRHMAKLRKMVGKRR